MTDDFTIEKADGGPVVNRDVDVHPNEVDPVEIVREYGTAYRDLDMDIETADTANLIFHVRWLDNQSSPLLLSAEIIEEQKYSALIELRERFDEPELTVESLKNV